jgi:2-methylisocitrate lyase-like PEP mutase family enzyme
VDALAPHAPVVRVAIATTSAGVSWSLGRPDGQNLSRRRDQPGGQRRPRRGLFDAAAQAARGAAAAEGLPGLVINARTDVFLFQIGEPAGRLDDVLARAAAYATAGADSLFVPGLLDLGTLATLTAGIYDSTAGADSFGDINGAFPAR